MEKTDKSLYRLSRIVATLSATLSLAQPSEGYAQFASSTPSPQVCQAGWYQCIKQDQSNPKPGYVIKVFDQYVARRKIAVSLEDLFERKEKPSQDQICEAGASRWYDLMASEVERKDTAVRAYFVRETKSLCPQKKMPNRKYPWMIYKGR